MIQYFIKKADISLADIIGLVVQPHLKIIDRQIVYTFNKKLKVQEKLFVIINGIKLKLSLISCILLFYIVIF